MAMLFNLIGTAQSMHDYYPHHSDMETVQFLKISQQLKIIAQTKIAWLQSWHSS